MSNIEFEQGQYGLKVTVKTEWHESFLQLLDGKEVKELEINTGKGWRGENVGFLKFLPNLESLILIDQTIKSIEEIHYLNKLKSVNISTYCKTPINFSKFPNLVNCGLEWRRGQSLYLSV